MLRNQKKHPKRYDLSAILEISEVHRLNYFHFRIKSVCYSFCWFLVGYCLSGLSFKTVQKSNETIIVLTIFMIELIRIIFLSSVCGNSVSRNVCAYLLRSIQAVFWIFKLEHFLISLRIPSIQLNSIVVAMFIWIADWQDPMHKPAIKSIAYFTLYLRTCENYICTIHLIWWWYSKSDRIKQQNVRKKLNQK